MRHVASRNTENERKFFNETIVKVTKVLKNGKLSDDRTHICIGNLF